MGGRSPIARHRDSPRELRWTREPSAWAVPAGRQLPALAWRTGTTRLPRGEYPCEPDPILPVRARSLTATQKAKASPTPSGRPSRNLRQPMLARRRSGGRCWCRTLEPRKSSRNHERHERHEMRRAGGIGVSHLAGELLGWRATTLPPFVFRLFVSFVVQPDCRFQVYRGGASSAPGAGRFSGRGVNFVFPRELLADQLR